MTAPRFTVFTATHQRARWLPDVHRSLAEQTFRDFEWVVVDDGSTDGTRRLVDRWAGVSDFPIDYVRQQHAGKPTAYNRALDLARGELFVNLDSDDRCVPHALEVFERLWSSIPVGERDGYAGVCCCCEDEEGQRISGPFPGGIIDASDREIRYRFRVRADRWGAIRTAVLRQHPYPDVPGEPHLPEGIVHTAWPDLPMRCTSETLLVYRQPDDGGQLTRRPADRHARGHALWHRLTLERDLAWFRHDPMTFLRTAANYARFSLLDGAGIRRQWRELGTVGGRLLWVLGLPVGAAVALRDHLRAARLGDGRARSVP